MLEAQSNISTDCIHNLTESSDSNDTPTMVSEYEFDSDENGWDDIDLIQDPYLPIKPSSEIDNKHEECWKCIECDTINNVELSKRKYNYKCCGCQETFYIENQTEIIYSSHWDTINDFILKAWSCNKCTFINHNPNTNICQICQSIRSIKTEVKTTNNTTVDLDEYNKNNTQITHYNTTPWICHNCNGIEIRNDRKCGKCDCKKPIKKKVNYSIDLICGFCRKYGIDKMPNEIEKILTDYYNLYTFSCYPLYSYLTSYYNQYRKSELIGDQYIEYPHKNKWILQLKIDNNGRFMYDINIYDIEIGVIDDYNKKYVIYGDGRNNNRKYPVFNKYDIISVELDCKNKTLSFGINNNWFGVEFNNLSKSRKYRLYLSVKQQGVIVHLIE